jgi:cytoskeletal protein RodZ
MGDATPQKVKRVTKKAKAPTAPVVETTAPVPAPVVESTSVKTTDESVPASASASASASAPVQAKEKEIRLTEIPVVDEITALNLMVSFLGLAQKRGAYTIDEASKIWECIKKFQRPV